MASITDYLASKLKSLTPEIWDGFVRWIDARFRTLEEKADITDRVADSILARGLQVIEDGIGPSIILAEQKAAEIAAIADLGMIFTAQSDSAVLIGSGTKTFTIPETRRNQFSPAAIVLAYAGDTYENTITGFARAYNRTTGVLTVDVIDTKGSGIFNAWTITPVATTADLEALRDQVQADRQQAGINAGAAANSASNAQAIATDFRKKYLGAVATDPTIDGNGNPVTVGALYTNTASGKLRYYGPAGWQDTTAGSNILVHQFTTDDRGTASYPLPEAPVSKDNCFVILGGTTQMRSSFDVSGASIAFTADPGTGIQVEVTIIGQLGIGTPSDETVDEKKIKTSAIAAIRTKLGLDTLFAAKANKTAFGVYGGDVTAAAGDAYKAFRFTASAVLTLPDASTLPADWNIDVIPGPGNTITVTPQATQQIDGRGNGVTLPIYSARKVRIYATGTGYTTDLGYQSSGHTQLNGGPLAGPRNKLINADFDVWQRGTTQSAASGGYGSADRWRNDFGTGSTRTVSRGSFNGSWGGVPGNPNYYLSTTITASGDAAAGFVRTEQRMENFRTLAGKTCTLTIWARTSAALSIAWDFANSAGAGGSPSGLRTGLAKGKQALAANTWTKITRVLSMPANSGTPSGNGDDYHALRIWFSAGSDSDAPASSLGPQTGTFDIAHVSLVEGDATMENDAFDWWPIGFVLAQCYRYYWRGLPLRAFNTAAYAINAAFTVPTPFPFPMRAVPSVGFSGAGVTLNNCSVIAYDNASIHGARLLLSATAATTDVSIVFASTNYFEANAEL